MKTDPLQPFLDHLGYIVLDGGLATELEKRGFNLNDELWSARLLVDDPQAIKSVHSDYLAAGADCIISASYQGSIGAFKKRGLTESAAKNLLQSSVELAIETRDEFWSKPENREGRLRPLVAASIGPYGATLADGSEYTGNYDLSERGLYAFHRERWRVLSQTDADIIACETIPSFPEARALAHLLAETPEHMAWFSFSCRNNHTISDGTELNECLRFLNQYERVAAVGINCTNPKYVPDLIKIARNGTDKIVIVYPNSGETYDAINRCWTGVATAGDFAKASVDWLELGACGIGGCCRTGPDHIRRIRDQLAHYSGLKSR